MYLSNISAILKMSMRKDIRRFFYDIHKLFKSDPSYSPIRFLKANYELLKDKRFKLFDGKYVASFASFPIPSKALISYLSAVKDRGRIFSDFSKAKRTAPLIFSLALTNKCNYNCVYCSAKNRREGAELTTEEWKGVIKDIQDMGTAIIEFSGGEPLLRSDLEEIIKSVDDRTICSAFTNGSLLTTERAKSLKESGLYAISVSMDSVEEEINNGMRGNNKASENALSAVRNAVNAGLYTIITSVIAKNDLKESTVFNLCEFCETNKVNELNILIPTRCGNLLNKDSADDICYLKEDMAKLKNIISLASRKYKRVNICVPPLIEDSVFLGCGAGIVHSYVSYCGDLYPCDFVPLSFGNVREGSISELWSKMNETMGIPKPECLAQSIYPNLKKIDNLQLPLDKAASIEICSNYAAEEYPVYYKMLQGK